MPRPPYKLIRYGEEVLELPTIYRGDNGWWSVPAPYASKKFKTFGRGYKGQEEAERWLKRQTTYFLNDHFNTVPDELQVTGNATFDWLYPYHRGGGYMRLAWQPDFPAITPMRAEVIQADYHGRPKLWITKPLEFSAWHGVLNQNSMDITPEEAEQFRQAPVKTLRFLLRKHTNHMNPGLDQLLPFLPAKEPKDFLVAQRDGLKGHQDQIEAAKESDLSAHPWFIVGGAYGLSDKAILDKELVAVLPHLNGLFSVFAGFGVHIEVATVTQGGEERPQTVKVVVPGEYIEDIDGDPVGGRQTHEITFDTTSGVSVECGFVKDEDSYLAYQRRQAEAFFSELTEAPVEETWEETIIESRRTT